MAKRAFWPGFSWRILAHRRESTGKNAKHTGDSIDLSSGMDRVPTGYPGIRAVIDGDWEFDELVIDHWFHLEQMNDRDWWIGVGNPSNGNYFHINVHINGDKSVSVSIEDESQE